MSVHDLDLLVEMLFGAVGAPVYAVVISKGVWCCVQQGGTVLCVCSSDGGWCMVFCVCSGGGAFLCRKVALQCRWRRWCVHACVV